MTRIATIRTLSYGVNSDRAMRALSIAAQGMRRRGTIRGWAIRGTSFQVALHVYKA